MKRNRLTCPACVLVFVATVLFMGCSSENNIATDRPIDVAEKVQFSLGLEPFNADKEMSRALPQPKTIDLGNGLEAEISVETDVPEPSTRATPIYDGKYTIIALNSSGTRVGRLIGTVSGGKFTKDAGQHMRLAPGTYTFVCFNSAVTDDGTDLLYNEHNLQPTPQQEPLIGRTTTAISGVDYDVKFTMQRQVGRMRFRIVTSTSEGVGITAKILSNHYHFATLRYVLANEQRWGVNGADYKQLVHSFSYPTTGAAPSSFVKTHKSTTDYYYFLGSSNGFICSDTMLQFTDGTVYGKPVPTNNNYFSLVFNTSGVYDIRNKSYTFTIKFKTKDPLYLYQDGTIGYLGDKGTRTPVGIVITPKTETKEGMAVALKYVPGEVAWSTSEGQKNTEMISDFNTVFKSENGYEQTYNASMSTLGKAHAENPDMPAFYAAAHYTPTLNIPKEGRKGRWFLPSVGQWRLLAIHLLKEESAIQGFTDWSNAHAPIHLERTTIDKYFTDAGGDPLSDDYVYIRCSNQTKANEGAAQFSLREYGFSFSSASTQHQATWYVARAFVYF